MNCRNLLLGPTLLLSGLLGAANNANAWSFYWSKVEVQTSSWQNCMNIASGVSKKQHLANVKRDNLGVTGTANGASATITCVGTGGNSKAMAIVMVVGDADGPVGQLRDLLVGLLTENGSWTTRAMPRGPCHAGVEAVKSLIDLSRQNRRGYSLFVVNSLRIVR